MIKSLFLFCTKPWFYLSEIPPIILLVLAIMYNDDSEELVGLVPLILLMIFFIVFFFLFLFRAVIIKSDEIRKIGVFTDKDKVIIKKDMTLSLTLLKHRRIKIELFGTNDSTPVYPWLLNSPTHELCMFRSNVVGAKGTVKKILRYFSLEEMLFEELFGNTPFKKELSDLSLSTEDTDDGRKINIKFLKTI
jgi:hypothetical protein